MPGNQSYAVVFEYNYRWKYYDYGGAAAAAAVASINALSAPTTIEPTT